VGAYEYAGVNTNPVVSVSPSSLDFGVVSTNTTTDRSMTVWNVGVGTLSGTATVPAPFSIISGGSYSLGANQSQTVTVRYMPTAAGNHSANVTLSGGGGAVASVSGAVCAVLPGLAFAADAGLIKSPFVSNGGVISQSVASGVSNGGLAVYMFALANAGDYAVQAVAAAPSGAENSFYVNIDAEPTEPYMVWHVPVASGFQESFVSWQGAGTYAQPQFVPKTFSLPAGTHQLLIRGREANTRLQHISIVKKASPPTGVRVENSQ
jgi:hypothetical protein